MASPTTAASATPSTLAGAAPLRVLLVDDSAVMRRLLRQMLGADPRFEVVGTAVDGRVGLALARQLRPDIVVLDVEMPELDGLETLRELRQTHPKLPVIMFSSVTLRGAERTLAALALGANDYVTKPSEAKGLQEAMERVREELVPRLLAFCGRGPTIPPANFAPPSTLAAGPGLPRNSKLLRPIRPVELLVIGTSTGGPDALAKLIPALPGNLGVAVLVVQHMPPLFTGLLAARLNEQSQLRVVEAAHEMLVEPGVVYLAPGDFHMEVARDLRGAVRVALHQGPRENSCRPAVDPLFRSAAQLYGGGVLAVVMTGMGQDGYLGSQAVRARGGEIFIQDQATSVVWGMPSAIANAGLADVVAPLDQLAELIEKRIAAGSLSRPAWRPTQV